MIARAHAPQNDSTPAEVEGSTGAATTLHAARGDRHPRLLTATYDGPDGGARPAPAFRDLWYVSTASGQIHRYARRNVDTGDIAVALDRADGRRILFYDSGAPPRINGERARTAALLLKAEGTAREVPRELLDVLLGELERVSADLSVTRLRYADAVGLTEAPSRATTQEPTA